MAARLLLIFIVVPIVELMLLIKIGGLIGVLPTLALVIGTAVAGSALVRHQGLTVINRIRAAQAAGQAPALAMLDGAALLLAGFMLLTPGFISDTLGFLLLVPKLRQRIARALLARAVVIAPGGVGARYAGRGAGQRRDDPDIIEGDYHRGKRDDRDGDRIGRDDHH